MQFSNLALFNVYICSDVLSCLSHNHPTAWCCHYCKDGGFLVYNYMQYYK